MEGVSAEELKESLAKEVEDEMGHARKLAKRIKILSGIVPGSFDFKPSQKSLQPTEETTNLEYVINGVIEAEENAIKRYNKIIALCEGDDYVTQELAIQILGDEESHKSEFEGFKKEFELKTV
jgi:bacterioferritin